MTQSNAKIKPSFSFDLDKTAEFLAVYDDQDCVILPVSRSFPASDYPRTDKNGNIVLDKENNPKQKFNGKNPSYINGGDKPVLLNYQQFLDRKPTQEEKDRWHSKTDGYGVLLTGSLSIVDLDRKHFKTQHECDLALAKITEKLDDCYIEKSRNGGYHIPVKCEQLPGFKNFKLEGFEKFDHIGEILTKGNPGFAVVAPTDGYTVFKKGKIPTIAKFEDLGFIPVRVDKKKATIVTRDIKPAPSVASESAPRLLDLMVSSSKNTNTSDRSRSIVGFAREAYGWANFCDLHNLPYQNSATEVIEHFASSLNCADRLEAILLDVDRSTCNPCVYLKNAADDRSVLRHYQKISLHSLDVSENRERTSVNKCRMAGMNQDRMPLRRLKNGDWVLPPESGAVEYLIAKYGEDMGAYQDKLYIRDFETGIMEVWHEKGTLSSCQTVPRFIADCIEFTEMGDYRDQASASWIFSTANMLRSKALKFTPCNDKNLIPLANGVLNVKKMKLESFDAMADQGFRFTAKSLAEFNPEKECPKFRQWLEESVDPRDVEKLKALTFATVAGIYQWKIAAELVGERDSGKSVYQRLIRSLLGDDDSVTALDLKKLLSDDAKFAMANTVGCKVILVSDVKGFVGSADKFKQLTSGGDLLEAEDKGKKSSKFVFRGLIWIFGNALIRFADDDDATRSRRIVIRFPNTIATEKQRSLLEIDENKSLSGDFADEMDGILNWVLSCKETAKETITNAKSEAGKSAELVQAENYLAHWFNACCGIIEGCVTQIGAGDKNELTTDCHPATLYSSYKNYCKNNGAKAKGLSAFKSELLEITNRFQKLVSVFDKQDSKTRRSMIHNVALLHDEVGAIDNHVMQNAIDMEGKPLIEKEAPVEPLNNIEKEVQTKLVSFSTNFDSEGFEKYLETARQLVSETDRRHLLVSQIDSEQHQRWIKDTQREINRKEKELNF